MIDIPEKYTVQYADDKFWNIPEGGHVCNGCEIIRRLAMRDIQNIDIDKLTAIVPKHDYGDNEFDTKLEADVANAGIRRFDFLSFYVRSYACDHCCLNGVHARDIGMSLMRQITPKIIVSPMNYTIIIRFRCCWPQFYETHIDYDLVEKDGDRV